MTAAYMEKLLHISHGGFYYSFSRCQPLLNISHEQVGKDASPFEGAFTVRKKNMQG